MKYTDEDIINKFSSLDLDPQGKKQAKIYKKITAAKAHGFRGPSFYLTLALGTAVLALIFVPFLGENDLLLSHFNTAMQTAPVAEKDIEKDPAPKYVSDLEISGNAIVPSTFVDPVDLWIQDGSHKNYDPSSIVHDPEESIPPTEYKDAMLGKADSVWYREAQTNDIVTAFIKPIADYNDMDAEVYHKYEENPFKLVKSDPLSTFSADVDTASYSILKRKLTDGQRPAPESVRIEEMLNYFKYSYAEPTDGKPVNIDVQYSDCPWNKDSKLVKIGLKAKEIDKAKMPPANLVFLIDVSGSMMDDNRLPLLKKAFAMLVEELRPQDKVSIVTYADGTKIVLDGKSVKHKEDIIKALDSLMAGGGTAGSDGLTQAYIVARRNFIKNGNNRVILATDGDFNLGPCSEEDMKEQIADERKSGVFISVIGVGMGNYQDSTVQTIADNGNGNYAYVNNLIEAEKVFVKEFSSTLSVVAKDVKLQVEFNQKHIGAYRLIGYEKRKLNNEDFNDDTKDAGEMGAGQTVTALYEVIPQNVKSKWLPSGSELKYTGPSTGSDSSELLSVRLRYKDSNSTESKLVEKSITTTDYAPFAQASEDFRFAAAVAGFGQVLKDSPYKGTMTYAQAADIAKGAKGQDEDGDRAEFVKIANLAKHLPKQKTKGNAD